VKIERWINRSTELAHHRSAPRPGAPPPPSGGTSLLVWVFQGDGLARPKCPRTRPARRYRTGSTRRRLVLQLQGITPHRMITWPHMATPVMPPRGNGKAPTMIILGLILLLVGYLTGLSQLYYLGGILLIIGIVFLVRRRGRIRSPSAGIRADCRGRAGGPVAFPSVGGSSRAVPVIRAAAAGARPTPAGGVSVTSTRSQQVLVGSQRVRRRRCCYVHTSPGRIAASGLRRAEPAARGHAPG
jgi:hypothetical protein